MQRLAGRLLLFCAVILAAAAVRALPQRGQQPASSAEPRPNIILIMTDDMGYADLGSYGGTDIKTPNIDRLARDGVRLTDAYANGVLCSPTRAALISGRYPQRNAIETALGGEGTRGLPVTDTSMPLLMKNGGYRTALVGKWHLGGSVTGENKNGGPRAHGFDYFFGFMGSHVDYWHHNRGPAAQDLWENESKISMDGQYLTTLITQRTIRFIEESAPSGQPFFVDVAYNAPHWPYNRPDRPSPAPGSGAHVLATAEDPSTRADYASMIEAADAGVGEIVRAVERLGLTRNTLIIFTNDNGGEWLSNAGPLFNRKWTVWEGGIRVPAIVKWPGRIRAGSVSDQPAITFDWSASIVAAAGLTVPPQYEGMNVLPILEGRAPKVSRTFYWRTAPNSNRTQQAVRDGDWKLVVDANHMLLFNVRQDIGERTDLTARRPEIVRRLRPMLTEWARSVDAEGRPDGPDGGRPGGPGGRGGPAGGRPGGPAGGPAGGRAGGRQ
jgi:arylsulfatase A-like enzyme